MKKSLVILCATLVAMVACNKEIDTPVPQDVTEPVAITFNLNVTHPDVATKAVKTGWETDDVVFVFFSNQTAPAYLEMKWNGSSWVNTEHGLSLAESESGTMTAVFLPFGSDATVSASGTSYVFSKNPYSYYLTASLAYTVTGGVVEGTFDMQIPAGFVQFFVDNASASSSDVIELREPPLTPVCIASVSAAGAVVKSTLAHGAPLPGYVYDKEVKTGSDSKGYLFSGILASGARNVSTDYNFTLVSGGFYGNYYSKSYTGKTFYRGVSDGRAIKLPVAANWTEVNDHKPIDMGMDVDGKRVYWAACNVGADNSWDYGNYYAWGETVTKTEYKENWSNYFDTTDGGSTFTKYNISGGKTVLGLEDDAANKTWGDTWRIPTLAEWKALLNSTNFTWTWTSDYNGTGVAGRTVTSNVSGNFIFLPAAGFRRNADFINAGPYGYYWSSSLETSNSGRAYHVWFDNDNFAWRYDLRSYGYTVRAVTE